MNRLERISAILVKLQSRPVVTASEIAEQFGVSLRTVYRDIRALEESGIPVGGEAGVGYSLVDGFKLPPLMFNTEEALSFLVAEKLVSHQTDGDTYGLFRSGMDKIRAVLKTAEKDILHHFDQYIRISGSYSAPPAIPGNVLQPLLKGLLNKKQLLMTYRTDGRASGHVFLERHLVCPRLVQVEEGLPYFPPGKDCPSIFDRKRF